MNTGFLRLCIYTFRYFEKEKQKINSLKISGFQCGKPTYSAKRLYLLRSLFWLCQSDILAVAKVIFRLIAEVKVNPQLAHGAHCTFKIVLSGAAMLTLMLVCAFFPRVHSIPMGPRLEVFRNDKSALHGSEQRALSRRRNMRCTWKYNSPKAQKKSPIARWFFFC